MQIAIIQTPLEIQDVSNSYFIFQKRTKHIDL